MEFRRFQKTVSNTYIFFGIISIVFIVFTASFARDMPFSTILGLSLVLFLVPSIITTFMYFLLGAMDRFRLDEDGITVTPIRLTGKKESELILWADVTSIRAERPARGMTNLVLVSYVLDGRRGEFREKDIRFEWSRKAEEYLRVNHPEFPFPPLQYGKR